MNNQTIDVLNKRDIDNILFSINIISQEINFIDGNGYAYKRNINILIGCTIHGVRKYITSVFDDEFSKTSQWYELFLNLKNFGLNHAFYIITSNDTISNAFKLAFKDGKCFYSILNNIYKLNHYISFSYTNDILEKIRKVCLSNNIDEYFIRKNNLLDLYNEFIFIKDKLEIEFNNFNKNLEYDLFIRRHLLSFYFIRDFKKKLMSSANSKDHFYSIDEYITLILPAIQKFESRMYCSKKEWNQIISLLYKDYKDLLLCSL